MTDSNASPPPPSELEIALLERLNRRFCSLQSLLFPLWERRCADEKNETMILPPPGGKKTKNTLIAMMERGSPSMGSNMNREEVKKQEGTVREDEEEKKDKGEAEENVSSNNNKKNSRKLRDEAALLHLLWCVQDHLTVLEKKYQVYVWPPSVSFVLNRRPVLQARKKKHHHCCPGTGDGKDNPVSSSTSPIHGAALSHPSQGFPHSTGNLNPTTLTRRSSSIHSSSDSFSTNSASCSLNSSASTGTSRTLSSTSSRNSLTSSRARTETTTSSSSDNKRENKSPHARTCTPQSLHSFRWKARKDRVDSGSFGGRDAFTSQGQVAAYQRACYERLLYPYLPPHTTPTTPASFFRGSQTGANGKRSHRTGGEAVQGGRGKALTVLQERLPLRVHPLYLSGGMRIPFPADLERSKQQWEKELTAVETLHSRHGVSILQAVEQCERLLQSCQAMFRISTSSTAMDSPSSVDRKEEKGGNGWAECLHRWIRYYPEYEIASSLSPPSSPPSTAAIASTSTCPQSGKKRHIATASSSKEEDLWKRIAKLSCNPLYDEEKQEVSSSSVPRRLRPRTLQDLYILCRENEERYQAIKQRWSKIKEGYLQAVSLANGYLSSVTLQLDEMEEKEAMKKEKEEREQRRREEED